MHLFLDELEVLFKNCIKNLELFEVIWEKQVNLIGVNSGRKVFLEFIQWFYVYFYNASLTTSCSKKYCLYFSPNAMLVFICVY